MSKELQKYMPENEHPDRVLLNSKIDKPLFERLQEIREEYRKEIGKKLTWPMIFTASLTWFCDQWDNRKRAINTDRLAKKAKGKA